MTKITLLLLGLAGCGWSQQPCYLCDGPDLLADPSLVIPGESSTCGELESELAALDSSDPACLESRVNYTLDCLCNSTGTDDDAPGVLDDTYAFDGDSVPTLCNLCDLTSVLVNPDFVLEAESMTCVQYDTEIKYLNATECAAAATEEYVASCCAPIGDGLCYLCGLVTFALVDPYAIIEAESMTCKEYASNITYLLNASDCNEAVPTSYFDTCCIKPEDGCSVECPPDLYVVDNVDVVPFLQSSSTCLELLTFGDVRRPANDTCNKTLTDFATACCDTKVIVPCLSVCTNTTILTNVNFVLEAENMTCGEYDWSEKLLTLDATTCKSVQAAYEPLCCSTKEEACLLSCADSALANNPVVFDNTTGATCSDLDRTYAQLDDPATCDAYLASFQERCCGSDYTKCYVCGDFDTPLLAVPANDSTSCARLDFEINYANDEDCEAVLVEFSDVCCNADTTCLLSCPLTQFVPSERWAAEYKNGITCLEADYYYMIEGEGETCDEIVDEFVSACCVDGGVRESLSPSSTGVRGATFGCGGALLVSTSVIFVHML